MARLDYELVKRGFAGSRERAKEMIKGANVKVSGKTVKKPSYEVTENDIIETLKCEWYVGRGALKLEKAAEEFGLDFTGKVCLDIGASTGGFTEYMIRHGADVVYAVDVGHGQLAEALRHDSRVINMEGTDIRKVTSDDIGRTVDIVSADVSFISLKIILPKISELLKDGGQSVSLIKPQFEAGRSNIGKRGIVKDRKIHEKVLTELDCSFRSAKLMPIKYTYSPIRGGSGNIEYLVMLEKIHEIPPFYDMKKLVDTAFCNV